jgi:hypothetical protein
MRIRLIVLSILTCFSFSLQAQFNFNLAQLQGTSSQVPTVLDFGPDGKLYVGEQYGLIKIYTINKSGNSYSVTNTQTVTLIHDMQNHNDNGADYNYNNSGYKARQITGIMVLGTAANPVMYVASSDARIGGGGDANDEQLDTNSGTISKLSWNGSAWEKIDLIRGLPRSEEAHAPNGMHLDAATNTLYVSSGGITNAGGPANNFVFTCEYALSGAILKIDMNVINSLPVRGSGNSKYVYDLPTLDDPTRTNITNPDYNSSLVGSQQTIDQGDPWGGNDGRNQAKLVLGGPVQIHSPGYRNAYDIVFTTTPGKEGRMYTVDNGPNQGWGGYPKNVNTPNINNEYQPSEPGSTNAAGSLPIVNNLDNLHLVSKPGMTPIYGGHPNPIRANPAGAGLYYKTGSTRVFSTTPQSDWPPLPLSMADPREANYLVAGTNDGALTTFPASTNGMAEYVSPNYFNGGITGDIFTVDLNGTLWRLKFNADGTALTTKEAFATGFATNLLDVVAQGAGEAFDGSIWVADYGGNKIFVFTPSSGPTGTCTGNNTSTTLDDDGDGFKNADEAANGTNPCSAVSFPPDLDGDKVSDKNDTDDDNDGIPDVSDVFYRDATNGSNTPSTIQYPFLNGNPGTGLFGLGFTGLMSNGTTDPDQLFNAADPGLIMGGAVGLASFPADEGKASLNNQKNGFQFGYKIPASPTPFSIQSSIVGPFFNGLGASSLNANHRQGIYLGTGDQNNFLAITLSGANGGTTPGFRIFGESGGSETFNAFTPVENILSASNIFIFLDVNPATKVVTARYSTNLNSTKVVLGSFTVTGDLATKLNGNAATAVGLLGYSGTSSTYQARFDYVNILPLSVPSVTNPVPDQEITAGTSTKQIDLANTFSDAGGVGNLAFSVSGNSNTTLVTAATISGTNLTLTFAANTIGNSLVKVKVTNADGQFVEDEFNVTVSGPLNAGPEVTEAISDQTVNVNTASLAVAFASTFSDDNGAVNLIYSVSGNNNPSLITGASITGTTLTLTIAPGQSGIAIIKLKATDGGGLFAEDEFSLTVNGAPVVANAITDKSVNVNTTSQVVSIGNVFTDDGGTANLVYTISGNNNTSLITATSINGTDLTLTIAGGQTGTATITLRATDAGGLFTEDEFVVSINQAPVVVNAITDKSAAENTASLNVSLANVFDDDLGAANLTYSISSNSNTTLISNTAVSGSDLTLTIAPGLSGTATIVVRATDAGGLFAEDEFIINVNGTPSIVTPVTDKSVNVNTANLVVSFANTFNDDGGAINLSYSVSGNSNNTLITNTSINGTDLTLTFAAGQTGNATIKLRATDAGGLFKEDEFTVSVNGAPAVVNNITDKSVVLNTANVVVAFANVFSDDGGNNNLVYSLSGNNNTTLITGHSFNGTDLTLIIAPGQTGTVAITLRATDAGGLFVEEEFNVAVNNTAPVITNAISDKSVIINAPNLIFSIAGVFTDDGGAGNLSYSVTDNSNTALITGVSINGTNVTLTIAPGLTGTATIKLKATDAAGLFVEDEFNVEVTEVPNTPPVISVAITDKSVPANTPDLLIDFTNTFTDNGGAANITYSVSANSNTALITASSINGTNLSLTIASGLTGTATIKLRATDAGGLFTEDEFIVTVTNTAPQIVNAITDQSVPAGTPNLLVSFANNFTDNASIANLIYSISGNTNSALITATAINGTDLTLTIAPGLTGTATIKLRATDGEGLFVEDEFIVTVTNTAPVIVNEITDKTVPAATPSLVVSFANTFGDNAGAANLVYSVSGNNNTALITGTSINGTNLTLTIAPGLTGIATIKLKATDGGGLFVEDEFNVTVSNTAPSVANAITDKTVTANTPSLLVSFANTFTDNGGAGNLIYSVSGNNNTTLITGTSISGTNLTLTIAAGQTGTATIKLRATDGESLFVEDEFNVTVTNTAPVIISAITDKSVTANTASLLVALTGVFNDDGGAANLVYSVSGNSNTALITAATINGSNLTLTIAAGQTGSSEIKVKATDGLGLFVEDVFLVTVTNPTPVTVKLINAGGPSITFSGQTWGADNSFSGGSSYTSAGAIAATTNDALYQTERFGNFSYAVPLANGSYIVKLHFAEIYFTSNNQRTFNVSVEGLQVLSNYDIHAKVGARTATTEQFNVNLTDGTININFTNVVNNAKVSAIEILSNQGSTPNNAPVIANAITDKSAAFNTASLVVAFANTFTDDGGAANLTYSVTGNTNTSLITGTSINGTNLTLNIASGQSGTSTIKLKATDAQGLFVEDEFLVTVNPAVNTAPVVANAVTDKSAAFNTASLVVAFANTFTDDAGAGNLTYSITGNSNTSLITGTSINGTNLTLTIASGQTGIAAVKLRATDAQGLFVEDEFNVTVNPAVNTAPVVANAITDKSVTVNTPSLVVAFANTFTDDAGAGNLTYSIAANSNTSLITGASINGTNLTFTIAAGQTGTSVITLRATDAQGLFVEDVFNVTVNAAVNTAPVIANAITDKSVTVNTASLVVAFANTFTDDGGAANLTYSVNGNSNTTLITGTSITGTNLTLTIAAGQTGTSTITLRATDAQGLFVEDVFIVTVTSAPAANAILINSGGPAVTLSSRVWAADKNFSGGTAYSYGSTAINGTTDDALYQTERFGNFSYAVPVTNGNYTVKLHFAETYFTANNSRVFNVNVENGKGILTNYDIYAQAGANTAKVETFSSIAVTDGTLNITFTTVTNNAKVCAIEIVSNSGAPNAAPVVANAITDKSVAFNTASLAVAFANTFSDDGGAANLTYSVTGNTNTALITGTSINSTNLTLNIASGQSGTSVIKLRATDAQGLFVEDEFNVVVNAAVNTAPVVSNAITDKSATVNTASLVVAFANTFTDNGGAGNLTYSITGNTNTSLITGTSISGTNLTLTIAAGQTGTSAITLRATDAQGLFAEDVFNVTVNAVVNTAPVVANIITDKSVTVNTASLVVAVANTFTDNGGVANLTFSITGNTNAALVTGTSFNGTNLTLSFAPALTGTANITVRATDSQGLFAEDQFIVTVTSAPPANAILINSGGPTVTLSGRTWAADKNFNGGTSYSFGSTAINGTTDDALYQTERFGNFNYAVPVTNGSYTVKLHFAETYFTSNNSRVFNVNIENGKGILTNYDIHALAGANTAKVETFSSIAVTDGTLNITFTTVTNNAKVNAIEIIPNNNTRIADPDATFDASLALDQVRLNWHLPETQTGAVTIERSADGVQFEELETIEPSARKVVSSGEYIDIRPIQGISYYRLRTMNRDGVANYSVTRSVVFTLRSSAFLLYPNPNTTNGKVFMEFPQLSQNETILIRILTVQGAEVYRGLKAERGSRTIMNFQLPATLRPGTYIIEADQNGKKRHARLVVN